MTLGPREPSVSFSVVGTADMDSASTVSVIRKNSVTVNQVTQEKAAKSSDQLKVKLAWNTGTVLCLRVLMYEMMCGVSKIFKLVFFDSSCSFYIAFAH